MSTGTPRLSRHERRAQLIRAAADAFLVGGYDGTSMDDVARTAGVSRLIVYRNFESKSDLYGAVLDSVLLAMGEAFATSELPVEDAVRVMLPVARANSSAFRLLWRHAAHEAQFRDRSDFLIARVHDGARASLAPHVTDPLRLDWAARAAGAHLMEGICAWLDVGEPARDAEVVEALERGLRSLAHAWSGAALSANGS